MIGPTRHGQRPPAVADWPRASGKIERNDLGQEHADLVGGRPAREHRAEARRTVLRRGDRRRRLHRAQCRHHAGPRRPPRSGVRQDAARRRRLLAQWRHRQRQSAPAVLPDDPSLRRGARHRHAGGGQGRTRGPRAVHCPGGHRLRLQAHRALHRCLEPRPVRQAAARGRGHFQGTRHRGLRARSRAAARRPRHRLLLGRHSPHGHRRPASGQAAGRHAAPGGGGRRRHSRRDGRCAHCAGRRRLRGRDGIRQAASTRRDRGDQWLHRCHQPMAAPPPGAGRELHHRHRSRKTSCAR